MTVRQRQPRIECPAFLAFVRRHACCACGRAAPSQAAHIRMGCREIGKRPTGIAEKPSDRWAVPLCAGCHLDAPDAQHRVGESVFWARVGLNPFELAENLYAEFEAEHPNGAHNRTHKKVAFRAKPRQHPVRASDSRTKLRPPKRKWPSRKMPSRPFPPGRGFR